VEATDARVGVTVVGKRQATAFAVDLLDRHGPLTIGQLLDLMPRGWEARLTDHPGQWLAMQLRHWGGLYRNPITKQWDRR
jgi:hypothetical protein